MHVKTILLVLYLQCKPPRFVNAKDDGDATQLIIPMNYNDLLHTDLITDWIDSDAAAPYDANYY